MQEVFVKVINTVKTGRYNEEGKFLPKPEAPTPGLFGQEKKPDKTFKEVFNIEDDSDFGIGFYD